MRSKREKNAIGDFEKILPRRLVESGTRTSADTELAFPYPEVEQAIQEGSTHSIAVLGVELFRVLDTGLGVENYSGYEFEMDGDWAAYVLLNNEAAKQFVAANVRSSDYGYILTTCSMNEFKKLRRTI